jgi:hypothetical protein
MKQLGIGAVTITNKNRNEEYKNGIADTKKRNPLLLLLGQKRNGKYEYWLCQSKTSIRNTGAG